MDEHYNLRSSKHDAIQVPVEIQMYNDSDFISKLIGTYQESKQTQQGYDTDSTSCSDLECSGLLNLSDDEEKTAANIMSNPGSADR